MNRSMQHKGNENYASLSTFKSISNGIPNFQERTFFMGTIFFRGHQLDAENVSRGGTARIDLLTT